MLAVLRAEIRNAWTPKQNHQPWTPQELGASGKAPERDPRKKWTPDEFRAKVVAIYGPDGRGPQKAGAPGSALASLRGTGQPIPA